MIISPKTISIGLKNVSLVSGVKKFALSLVLLLALCSLLVFIPKINVAKAEANTIVVVPDDYAPIQWAINDASEGDTHACMYAQHNPNLQNESEGVNFEPYVSTFHLLFEDGSHNLLGNLTGELRITEPEKEIIHSICKLSLSSPRPDEYHEPYIDKLELFTAWTFIIHPWGLNPPPMPPPYPQKVTLHVDEDIILFEHSRNVSGFVEEPRLVFWFSSGAKISNHEWGTLILPTIWVYFSDGQKWEWEYEYDITPPFKLWSGMDVNLSELSGKIETETITFTTVEKVSPPPSILGDLNNDGSVDISDVVIAGKAFASYLGHPRWDSRADINKDDVVDIFDIILIAKNFGKTV